MAFVSSVMQPELEWARRTTVAALTDNPILVPWAFEFTPASSESADASYLRKVRDADVVIWLAGSTTTTPVRNEISEALASGSRVWIIRVSAERDEETERLLREAGPKWADAANESELRELLALTLSDEIVRALRETPGLTRFAQLEQVARASRARMIVRWQATGLSQAEAIEWADDPSVGNPTDGFEPTDADPFLILVAPVGAGKSVIAERLLQGAIKRGREGIAAPIPIFLRARDARNGLEQAVMAAATGLGDPRQRGAYVVVDGADEVPQSSALELVSDARILVQSFPDTKVVVTTRPIAVIGGPEKRLLPELEEEASRGLVGAVAGYEITPGAAYGWPKSLADAVRRPLFAILLGLNRREHRADPPSMGALLATLVERVLDPERAARALPALRRLAAHSNDHDHAPIRANEIGDLADVLAVRESGLVVEVAGEIQFALPILGEWFAARSLEHGFPSVSDLVADPRRLDRWRYALAISLATGPQDHVDDVMDALAREAPGFASKLIKEAFSRWGGDRQRGGDDRDMSTTAGRQLRRAFLGWQAGIAPLDELLLPADANGSLAPVVVSAEPGSLSSGWYRGGKPSAEVVEFPRLSPADARDAGWEWRRSGRWSGEPGWAWPWSLELLRSDLQQFVKRKALHVSNEALNDEAVWVAARALLGRGLSMFDPVPLAPLEQALAEVPSGMLLDIGDRLVLSDDLRARFEALQELGHTSWLPWPGIDLPLDVSTSGWIWGPYSPERQRQRVEAVYRAALDAYEAIVNAWFPKLRNRMRIAATLPARLVGAFEPSATTASQWPTLHWYLDALPEGASNEITIEIGPSPPWENNRDTVQQVRERLVELRPQSAGWIGGAYWHGLADVFQQAPLADLVYEWIEDDLKAVNWAT